MTETEDLCEQYSRPTSGSWPPSTKLATGILLLIASILIKLLLDYGENIIVSWGNFLFLVLYTTILCLIFIIVNQSYFGPFSSTETSYLSPLFRVRSRLTFLPITHFIRQQSTTEKNKTCEDSCDEQSKPVAKTLSSRIEEQRDVLIDEILQGYVFPWYNRISDEETFPSHFKNVLQSVCTRFNEKLRQVDRTTLAKEAIQLVHCHWKEYCDVVSRGDTTDDNISKNFKLSHAFIEQKSELSRHYEHLVCLVLRELVIPDLQSNLLCQFLSGILVKCFVLYYVDMIIQPKWINTSLVCLISSGGLEMSHGGSHSCPLPETPVSTCSSSIFASEDSVIKITSSSPVSEDRPSQLYDKSLLDNGKSTPSPQPSVDFFNDELQLHSRNITPSDDSSLNEAHSKLTDFTSEEREGIWEFPSKTIAKSKEVENQGNEDVFGKNVENNETENDKLLEENEPQKNNLIDKLGKQDPLTKKNEEEEDSFQTKKVNGKKVVKEKLKLAKSNPLFGSVSSALSGLLTTAALPLLPEGCHGSLDSLSAQGTTSSTTEFTSSPAAATTTKELLTSEDLQRRKSSDDQRGSTRENENGNNLTCAEWKDQTIGNKVNSRHYSFDESAKLKNNYNLETKSLDESKSQVILRQEEFDYSNKDNERLTTDQTDKNNISPMYEEPEDFAATIAKLRSLLEQRESRKNLMDMDGDNSQSQDLPKTNSPEPSSQLPRNPVVKGRPSLNSQSSASSLGSDGSGSGIMQLNTDIDKMEKIVDELEDPEPIQCLFTNVTVSRAESLNDSSDQFTLYCIQYEGVYPEEDDDGQLGKIVLRTTTVKRRFKEFINLQSQLEDIKIYKPHLKGIKAPNKWLNLSFSKVDSAVLNQRKTLLEKYLQQLCYHPILGFCHELRQFMAYGEEGFNAFCLSDGGTNVHRFDKLAKKFTGVINTLRDALPTFESDSLSAPSSPDGGWKTPGDSKGSKLFSSFLQFGEKIPPEEIKTIITASTPETKATESEEHPWITESRESMSVEGEYSSEDKQEISLFAEALSEEPLPEETNASIYPLAAAVTQLLCDVLWLPDHRPHTASVGAFMSISGKSLENYVQETLDMFLSEEAFLGYMELFTSAMKAWNDSNEIIDEQTGYYTELDLKNCLKKKIPVWVRWMWGRHRLDMTIERMARFCQNSVLNHDLILSLIELIFSKILDTKESRLDNLNHNES